LDDCSAQVFPYNIFAYCSICRVDCKFARNKKKKFFEKKNVKAGCFKKSFAVVIPNVAVWRVLQKRLHLKAYKLSIVQGVERNIVCTPLSVNVFVTLATQ
jgi:hypothetical protein